MATALIAALGHPITGSRISFYSTLALVNTFVIGAVLFNFRAEYKEQPSTPEGEQRSSTTAAQILFILPTLLLVASETLAFAALYLGRDDDNAAFTAQLLTTLGAGIFFVLLATRIIDPSNELSDKATCRAELRRAFYIFLFAASILVPLLFLTALKAPK